MGKVTFWRTPEITEVESKVKLIYLTNWDIRVEQAISWIIIMFVL